MAHNFSKNLERKFGESAARFTGGYEPEVITEEMKARQAELERQAEVVREQERQAEAVSQAQTQQLDALRGYGGSTAVQHTEVESYDGAA